MNIQRISVEKTLEIRNEILRPGLPLDTCQFEEDQLSGATHFGSFEHEEMTGVVSVYPISPAHDAQEHVWQFRAMATREKVRGLGHGRALIMAMEEYLGTQQASLVWCNARVNATGFYQKLGYLAEGKIFEVAGVGPHIFMHKQLST